MFVRLTILLLIFFISCSGKLEKPRYILEWSSPNQYEGSSEVANSHYYPGTSNIVWKHQEALDFCKSKGLSTKQCVMVDMSIHSGYERLFIWDFENQIETFCALVGHGDCGKDWTLSEDVEPEFSDRPKSRCTPIGKFKIGSRGYIQYGVKLKYTLHGLESSNRNAISRGIVLHSSQFVPDERLYPEHIVESYGCPIVSNNFFGTLDQIIQQDSKPLLFWIIKD